MTRQTYILSHDMARQRAVDAVRSAPDGQWVTVGDPVKSREQEEHYHAQIRDIARQYVHAGRKWEAEDMKRLLVAAFKEETRGDPDLGPLWKQMGDLRLAPPIRGDGFVTLGDQTRRFPRRLASAFIEWLYAFGVEAGVEWSEPERCAA